MKLHSLLRQISHPKSPWVHHLHTSSTHEILISEEVCTILETISPMEPALDPIVPFLSRDVVTSVIKDPPNPQLGFRFFIWASRYNRFRSWLSHSLILDMLIKESKFELYWQVLEDVNKSNFKVSADAFTVLIQAYAKMGMAEKAVEAFGMMRDFNCEPDICTYNTILHVVLCKEVLLLALAIYNKLIKLNCSPNVATFSILIDGLCKSGRTQDALKLYDEMTERGISPNKITYTIIIAGLCRAQKPDDAYRLFETMKESGCSPDFPTYNSLLNGFSTLGRFNEAFALLRSFQKEGYVLDICGYSCLIDGLFRAKRYEEAQEWYRKMIEANIRPDTISYAIMIKGLSEAGKVRDAFGMLNEMTERGLPPDTHCYNALIKGFCDVGLLDQAQSLRLEISQPDFSPDACTYSILICGMCKNGLVDKAEKIFNEMDKLGCCPSVVAFNALIDGLCKAGNLEKARHFLYQMEIGRNPSLLLRLSQGANRVLDSASLQTMVEQLCESGLILKAYRILMQLADSGVAPDVMTYNILINGFCKARNINGAFKLFEELQFKGLSPDSITYGTLINGLQRLDREEDAFGVFDQMIKNGCMPGISVYRSLMTWSCRRRKVSVAFSIWLKYLREVLHRDDEVVKAIEENFDKGEVDKAVRSLLEMDFKSYDFQVEPYTIFLIGLCQVGRVEDASKIFFVLGECKVIVSPPSCVKLINCLCKRGDLDLAINIFLYTIEKGYILQSRTCNHLLRSLLRSEDKKNCVFDLLSRMKLLGYDLGALLNKSTKFLLRGYNKTQTVENVSSG